MCSPHTSAASVQTVSNSELNADAIGYQMKSFFSVQSVTHAIETMAQMVKHR